MILLIDNYDSFTYNLYQYLSQLGAEVEVIRNDKITLEQIQASLPEAIVMSPGPGRPEDSGVCVDIVKSLSGKLPILGVCLGHQVIGQVFGGRIIVSPTIMHGKVSLIEHDGKHLFKHIPSPFLATRYHSLAVEANSVPECLEVSARSQDGIVMGLRHRELPHLYGVQFHPESIMTQHGMDILRNFLKIVGE